MWIPDKIIPPKPPHTKHIQMHLVKDNHTQIAVSGAILPVLRRPAISSTTTRRKIGGMKRPSVPPVISLNQMCTRTVNWSRGGPTFHWRYDFTFISLTQSSSLDRAETRDRVRKEGRVLFILRESFWIKCERDHDFLHGCGGARRLVERWWHMGIHLCYRCILRNPVCLTSGDHRFHPPGRWVTWSQDILSRPQNSHLLCEVAVVFGQSLWR